MLCFCDTIPDDLATALSQGLECHNALHGLPARQSFGFESRNGEGALDGGITANCSFGVLFVNNLWVAPEARGKGLGAALMKAAEEEGRRRGAELACVDTLSIQAPDFYPKLGYVTFGRIEGRVGGRTIERIWFRKPLGPAAA